MPNVIVQLSKEEYDELVRVATANESTMKDIAFFQISELIRVLDESDFKDIRSLRAFVETRKELFTVHCSAKFNRK